MTAPEIHSACTHVYIVLYTLKFSREFYFVKLLTLRNVCVLYFHDYIACLVLRPVTNKFSLFLLSRMWTTLPPQNFNVHVYGICTYTIHVVVRKDWSNPLMRAYSEIGSVSTKSSSCPSSTQATVPSLMLQ